jgi:hypothetical protein
MSMLHGAEQKRRQAGRRLPRSRVAGAIRWGVVGFALGVAGWSLVGIWDMAARWMLPTPPEAPPGCTALVIDPATGQTKAEACLTNPA